MDWNALPGKTARAKIGVKPGTKDPSKKFNYIEKLYPKDSDQASIYAGEILNGTETVSERSKRSDF